MSSERHRQRRSELLLQVQQIRRRALVNRDSRLHEKTIPLENRSMLTSRGAGRAKRVIDLEVIISDRTTPKTDRVRTPSSFPLLAPFSSRGLDEQTEAE